MYILKEIPEDFVVEEIPIEEKFKKTGKYSIFKLTKKNKTTIETIDNLAKRLKTKVGYAGIKDKKAITIQYISILGNFKKIEDKNIKLEFIAHQDEPISLGDLKGNEFKITVRNLEKLDIKKLESNSKQKQIINYFGEQRFSKNNIEVGRSLIKKEFKKAFNTIQQNDNQFRHQLNEYIKDKKTDFIGALKLIPRKLLLLYIHAYQSYIWNLTAEKIEKQKNIKIPILGFGTELNDNEISEIIKDLMKKENITERDFIIREIPEISSDGGERDLFMKVKNQKYKIEKDEVYKNNKAIINFELEKGSYATEFIKFLFH